MSLGKSKAPIGWKTGSGERKGYYVYFTGQNIFYAIVSNCLTTYFALIGVDLIKIAGVMLAVKVWDAVNDAIFGVVFDAVKFKSGKKYLPWLRISLVLIPLATIAMFAIPRDASEIVKLAWFAAAYLVWDTMYTLCDVPIYGIITAMTDNVDERNSMMSYKSIWGGVGGFIGPLVVTTFVSEKVGSNYTVAVIVCAIIGFATMIPACFGLKERIVPVEEESFSLGKMFKYLFNNKYLLLYYSGFLFYSSVNYVNALNVLVSYYLFHDTLFTTFVGLVGAPFSLVGALIVPKLVRKFDKIVVFRASVLLTVVTGIIMWLVGYQSLTNFFIINTIRTIPLSTLGVMLFMFTPDCAEYGKYKTGIDAKGITFSIQTFMVKLTAAISSALSVFLLGLEVVGWVNVEATNFDELTALGVTQTPHALDAFWLIYALIPSLGYLASYFVWRFYNLKDKDVQIMAECNAGKITKEEAEAKLSRKY